jgi:non-lysosomal glucosylceramidase
MSNCNCGPNDECKPGLGRRLFLRNTGAGAVALTAMSKAMPVMAGPFEAADFEKLVPSDKKLSKAWIRSLTAKGVPEVFSGWEQELKYIGMPIGGIGCGQLYLGGDGRLWLWDIFKSNYAREPDHGNKISAFTLGGHYAHPVALGEEYTKYNGTSVEQGFLIRAKSADGAVTRTLDKEGFPGVTFRGEYPVGRVTYTDAAFPAEVELEAFSPFIPLNAKDSALPATVMRFTVKNTSGKALEIDLGGWLQNATCPSRKNPAQGRRVNRLVKNADRFSILSTVDSQKIGSGAVAVSEDIVFADFESDDWGEWIAEGDAFKGGPFPVSSLAAFHALQHASGQRIANSLNTLVDPSAGGADNLTGTLTSPAFTIERKFIRLLVAGGARPDECYAEVLVDGQSVAKVTGDNSVILKEKLMDLSAHEGKQAVLRIVDKAQGGWAHIVADRIVFTDQAAASRGPVEESHGYGSMALSVLTDAGVNVTGASALKDPESPEGLFAEIAGNSGEPTAKPLDQLLVGGLSASVSLKPGESQVITYLVSWYFPYHLEQTGAFLFDKLSRHYRPWFMSAGEVADTIATRREQLIDGTLNWNRTWYDSTLPTWLLDRSMIALDCTSSQMFHWFDNGRPYAWEGVDCCPGTCTHVFHYAQAMGRIFPELERAFREKVDYQPGVGFDPQNGMISDRGEFHMHAAIDGQAGTILRAYREHQMSADDQFLTRLWPNIKKSIEFLMAEDKEKDGLLRGAQPHTLDAAWYGPMGWMSGMYLAALAAGEQMALEMRDVRFAKRCNQIMESGRKLIVSELFNGEYFIHKPDPNVPNAIRTGTGCHIDQVLGQSWAYQVGLGRVIPKQETVSALNSLWKYNFAPDAGQYALDHIQIENAVRWYAMPGEAGLLMTTWPKGGATEAIPGDRLRSKENPEQWTGPGGYFNECMNGFEYQVAGHMVAEGKPGSELVEKGLAITKAVHERYGAARRNPYNEVECGDHYARSMASFGIYLAACGYEYHGPKGYISFAPKIRPEDFRAAFTAAEGWGTFAQTRKGSTQSETLQLNYGQLNLKQLTFALPAGKKAAKVQVTLDGAVLSANHRMAEGRVVIRLADDVTVQAGQVLEVKIQA